MKAIHRWLIAGVCVTLLVFGTELVYSDRTVREELTFPLEWDVDSDIYIP